MTTGSSRARGWLQDLRVYAEPPVARMVLLGFAAGLPLLLVLGTLSFRLREAGIDRTTIGFLSWVGLAYGFKWVWAPLVDRMPLPLLTRALGRRRSWLLAAQLVLAAGLAGMALTDAAQNLHQLVALALLVAFASATQDIALDAYRIESAEQSRQAAMAAAYQVGYRAAMITASGGALWIASTFDPDETTYQHAPWLAAYLCMAGLIGVGIVTVLFSSEPQVAVSQDTVRREQEAAARLHSRLLSWLYAAVVSPFLDFVLRYRWQALLLLALIGTYRISDIVLGVMSNPFYRDMGFTKDEVAAVSGVYGVLMTLAGAALGGVLALRYGVMRVLMLGAALSALTNLLFAWLATRGHDLGGQPERRHRQRGLRRLPLGAHQRRLLGHAVRAFQLGDAAAAEIHRRLVRLGGRQLRLPGLLHRHGAARHAGAPAHLARRAHGGEAAGGSRGSLMHRSQESIRSTPAAKRG